MSLRPRKIDNYKEHYKYHKPELNELSTKKCKNLILDLMQNF